MTIAVLILAAGAATRMRGGDKLLELVAGKPLLRCLAERALAAGAEVGVALPPGGGARAAALDGLTVTRIDVPDASDGLSASLKRGVAALTQCAAVMVLPGDMPEVSEDDLRTMIETFRQAGDEPILRATDAEGRPGHPVLFPRRIFPDFARLTGDTGAAPILKTRAGEVVMIALPGRHATTDLDDPEAWVAWRAASGKGGSDE